MTTLATPTISIRAATANDGRALMRLAALDSSRMPFGPVLLAEVDGELKAAIDVREDRVIADPFSATTDVVDLLRLHARAIAQREESRIERPALGALRLAA